MSSSGESKEHGKLLPYHRPVPWEDVETLRWLSQALRNIADGNDDAAAKVAGYAHATYADGAKRLRHMALWLKTLADEAEAKP